MSRLTRRTAWAATAVVALGVTTTFTGAQSATGQEQEAPPPASSITVMPALPSSGGESSGSQVSKGFDPGTTTESTSPTQVVPFNGEGMGTESVIGVDGRVQVTATTTYPASAIGQIELTDFNGAGATCTGWLIDANTILTSGHCAFTPHPSGNHGIQSAFFSPGRNGGTNPFGTCAVNSIFAKAGWRVQGNARDDWAVMGLDCSVGNTVGFLGYFSLTAVNGLDGKTGRVEGYPGDKPFGTHWKMSGTMSTRTDANMIHYPIDTFGGQSGSPIMVANRPACGGPCGMGIHSYGAGGNPPLNSGPRITNANFDTIVVQADFNNP